MNRRWRERRWDEPPPQVPQPASPAAANDLLCQGRVLSYDLIPWGSNYTFLASLSHGDKPEALAVYKPRRGEAPLWDFPEGTLYRRERAAYLVSKALGWDFIPLTVVRDGPEGVGSMQLFVETEGSPHRPEFTDVHRPELARIALYDLITNNADRKAGHCLLGTDGRVWGIDHGLTFHVDPKLRTVLWEFYQEPIPPDATKDLCGLLASAQRRDALAAELGELLSRAEVHNFFSRAERVLEAGEYSAVNVYRRRPWPFF
ncbi:MAG TPA: SCO1664 family protein [Chloroflexota bacterium]